MKLFCDLHIHSKYSRGTSKDISLNNLEDNARKKGINILGTGDFTHPEWLRTLSSLKEENGFLLTKTGFTFCLQTEVSLIFKKAGKLRKIHLVLLSPSLRTSKKIAAFISNYTNIEADGRPTISIDAERFIKELKQIDEDIEVIPAHVWTPWFGLFGSKSGFDSVEDCFSSMSEHIHALETGLSSDPEMNWMISSLDKYELVSFSDAHSFWPHRLGREATLVEMPEKKNYQSLISSIREKKVVLTIEVNPAYGKYYLDGHRKCGFYSSYKETEKLKGICPKCKKPLTIGVLNRVASLANREKGEKPDRSHPFIRMLPLMEIIAFHLGKGITTKTVRMEYERIISEMGNEYHILLDEKIDRIKEKAGENIGEIIKAQREDNLSIKPGFDGEYGKIIDY
jgi:uncharacterized protein (TIGR00375 family)